MYWPTAYSREVRRRAIKNRVSLDVNAWKEYKVRLLRNGLCGKFYSVTIASKDVRALYLLTWTPMARHRCDLSSELCCPGAKLRSLAPATRYTLRRNIVSIMNHSF